MVIRDLLIIDGTDITEYIAEGGIQWSRNDLDGPNAGRTLSGLMIRDRVAIKAKLTVKCKDLDGDKLRMIMRLTQPQFVSVTYDDPLDGIVTKTMYSNNNTATLINVDTRGRKRWNSVSFPLIER